MILAIVATVVIIWLLAVMLALSLVASAGHQHHLDEERIIRRLHEPRN